jgi:hypothetical protein
MTDYIGVKGRYRPYDQDTEYLYIGRYTADAHHIGRPRCADQTTVSGMC